LWGYPNGLESEFGIVYPNPDPHGKRCEEEYIVHLSEWHAVAGHPGTFCPDCVVSCDDCGEVWIFDGAVERAMVADPYQPGASFLRPGCYGVRDIVCVSCFEAYCGDCGCLYGENADPCEGCNPDAEDVI
jgi:hypothetical protein